MIKLAKKSLLAAATLAVLVSTCHGNDPRCAAPPYGDTVQAFQAFVKNFEKYVAPAKVLSSMCQMKFGGADRAAMYNLGFADQEID
jgi:hypothetical protein